MQEFFKERLLKPICNTMTDFILSDEYFTFSGLNEVRQYAAMKGENYKLLLIKLSMKWLFSSPKRLAIFAVMVAIDYQLSKLFWPYLPDNYLEIDPYPHPIISIVFILGSALHAAVEEITTNYYHELFSRNARSDSANEYLHESDSGDAESDSDGESVANKIVIRR